MWNQYQYKKTSIITASIGLHISNEQLSRFTPSPDALICSTFRNSLCFIKCFSFQHNSCRSSFSHSQSLFWWAHTLQEHIWWLHELFVRKCQAGNSNTKDLQQLRRPQTGVSPIEKLLLFGETRTQGPAMSKMKGYPSANDMMKPCTSANIDITKETYREAHREVEGEERPQEGGSSI